MPVFAVEVESAAMPALPPQAPFAAKPQPGTRWEISFQNPDQGLKKVEGADSANTSKLPLHVVSVLTHCGEEISHITVTWSDGTVQEAYVKGTYYYQLDTKNKNVFSSPVQENRVDQPYFVSSYQGISWLTVDDFKEIAVINKEKCYRFYRPAVIADSSMGGVPELTAWIRVRDKIPLQFKIGDLTYVFSAISLASSRIDIPAEVRSVMQQVEKEQHLLEQMRKANQGQ